MADQTILRRRDVKQHTHLSKASNQRRPDIRNTVEGEAMPAHLLREMLRNAIEPYPPTHAFATMNMAEEEEKRGVQRCHGRWLCVLSHLNIHR